MTSARDFDGTETEKCPECGTRLAAGGSHGLCPRCLLGADLDAGLTETTVRIHPSETGADYTDHEFTGPKRVGCYRILGELGSGGMGTVFEALDERMDRRVALKILSLRLSHSKTAWKRFEQEAWIAGRLSHPSLVKVYERGQEQGLGYYSMELVEGPSLHDVIRNLKEWGRDDVLGLKFGSKEYVDWAITQTIRVARALEYAHTHGVVHRDIKPMNLLIERETGDVKVTDFGLALDAEATRLTATGDVLGTPSYMAPEQLQGRKDEIGARTDVYALGVTLFELLTLQLPFKGESREVYTRAVLTDPARRARPLNQKVSRDLETVIGKALEKSPRDRYASAASFADELERTLRLQPIEARPPRAHERLWKWARRRPVHATLAATLAIALPLTAVLGYRTLQHQSLLRQQSIAELEERIRSLGQSEKHAELIETAGELLALEPDHDVVLRSRAIAALSLWREDPALHPELETGAMTDIRRFVELDPESAGRHRLEAYVLRKLGRETEADSASARAEQLRGPTPSDDDLELDGLMAFEEGDYELAVELLTELHARHPQKPLPVEMRAMAFENLGQLDRAIQDYRLLCSLSPDNARYRYNLGRIETSAENYDTGVIHLRRAIELAGDDANYHAGLAQNRTEYALAIGEASAQATEALAEAEGAARRSIELDADYPIAHLNLAAALLATNQLAGHDPDRVAEALAHYDSYADLMEARGDATARIEIQNDKCDAFLQGGALDQALEICFAAADSMPESEIAFYNLAAAYALLGRTDDALDALERDVELGDDEHEELEQDPWFESIREEPRFGELLERMKNENWEQPARP